MGLWQSLGPSTCNILADCLPSLGSCPRKRLCYLARLPLLGLRRKRGEMWPRAPQARLFQGHRAVSAHPFLVHCEITCQHGIIL